MKKFGMFTVLFISLFVFTSMATAKTWTVPKQFKTIQAAVNNAQVGDGDTIVVARGDHMGAAFTKAAADKKLTIKGAGIDKTFIVGGPKLFGTKAGFYFKGFGAGTTITNMTFEVSFPVYAVGTSGIKVNNTKMTYPVQGITNWGGSGWAVKANQIRGLTTYEFSGSDRAAGGIGIFMGTRDALLVSKNSVLNNEITGTIAVTPGILPAVGGITLYADYTEGKPGAVSKNAVKGNTISLRKAAGITHLHGIGLNENKDPAPNVHVIKGNNVTSNKFPLPKMVKVECYPEVLIGLNNIVVPKTLSVDEVSSGPASFNPL